MDNAGTLRTGFHLDNGVVVVCRGKQDGSWEAWIREPGATSDKAPGPLSPIFVGPSRFKAQCNAIRWWHAESVAALTVCA